MTTRISRRNKLRAAALLAGGAIPMANVANPTFAVAASNDPQLPECGELTGVVKYWFDDSDIAWTQNLKDRATGGLRNWSALTAPTGSPYASFQPGSQSDHNLQLTVHHFDPTTGQLGQSLCRGTAYDAGIQMADTLNLNHTDPGWNQGIDDQAVNDSQHEFGHTVRLQHVGSAASNQTTPPIMNTCGQLNNRLMSIDDEANLDGQWYTGSRSNAANSIHPMTANMGFEESLRYWKFGGNGAISTSSSGGAAEGNSYAVFAPQPHTNSNAILANQTSVTVVPNRFDATASLVVRGAIRTHSGAAYHGDILQTDLAYTPQLYSSTFTGHCNNGQFPSQHNENSVPTYGNTVDSGLVPWSPWGSTWSPFQGAQLSAPVPNEGAPPFYDSMRIQSSFRIAQNNGSTVLPQDTVDLDDLNIDVTHSSCCGG